ncbi:MAG: hypothetical protein LUE65_08760 [Clostridiales bacterium]|nr:hypothetical protein [Clostridiales bacterium]
MMINPVRALWELDLEGKIYAATSHTFGSGLVNGINRIRLDTEYDYFNTGVILIDLKKAIACVNPDDIFDYVEIHATELVLPDQDIFNALYGNRTKQIDDRVWNYDARYYSIKLQNYERRTLYHGLGHAEYIRNPFLRQNQAVEA